MKKHTTAEDHWRAYIFKDGKVTLRGILPSDDIYDASVDQIEEVVEVPLPVDEVVKPPRGRRKKVS